jgi:pilus assembly protein CpaC
MFLTRSICYRAIMAGVLGLLLTGAAGAQDIREQVIRADRSVTLSVPVYKSRLVELAAPASRVSIGNPDIADIVILRASQIYVLGKDLGSTNVILWDKDDRLISTIAVHVTHDLDALKRQLADILPGEPIEVYSAQRNIVLSGQVSSPTRMTAALQVAESYLEQAATAKQTIMFEQKGGGGGEDQKSGEVINLMSVGGAQQVMLEVKVAELQRTEMRKLNPQWHMRGSTGNTWVIGGAQGGASFPDAVFQPGDVRIPIFGDGTSAGANPIGPVFDEFMPNTQSIENTGLFAAFLGKDFMANLVIDVARERGLAKVLAEPTLTTLSGQEAQFLSGGSFPIPVPQQNGVNSIEFHDFGVALRFLPVILDSNRINLKLNISVSEIGPDTLVQTGVGSVFRVPERLSERRAISTVELADGETIGIAGLINENMRAVVNKFPLLGDIPILGQLFRSQGYQKGETELVILVTPRLAKPLAPDSIQLPTDTFVEPTQTEFYLLGRIEGREKNKSRVATGRNAGGAEGAFGHSGN